MKSISTLTVVCCLIVFNGFGQVKKPVKDSIPAEKQYVFVMNPSSYHFVDSVLLLSLRVAGYELKASEADGLRNSLSTLVNFFRQTAHYQDSIYNSQVLKPKK